VDGFVAAVRAVSAASRADLESELVAALGRLADLVEELGAPADAVQMWFDIGAIEAPRRRSKEDAELVERVLHTAQRALERHTSVDDPELVRAMVNVAVAVTRIDAARPLSYQRVAVVNALEATANAVALMHHVVAPFPTERDPELSTIPASPLEPAQRPAETLPQARDHTLALARTGWADAHVAAARLISDVARLIAAVDPDAAVIAELRFQAERLDRATTADLPDVTRWIKGALGAALEWLDRAGRGGPFVAAARAALANIDEGSTLPFEAATVQDAARATLDAFVDRMAGTRDAESPRQE
jgi:hypothetical protein